MLWEIVQAVSPIGISYPQLPPLDEISRQMTLIEEGARRQCIGSTRTMIDVAERVGRMFNHRAGADTGTAFSGNLASGYRSLREGVEQVLPGSVPQRVKVDSGYIDYEDAWKRWPQGSGEVTRRLTKHSRDLNAPHALAKLDASPEIRKATLDRFNRDAELAAQTGQPVREDVQRARKIIADEGLSGLLRAYGRGVPLPAAALVILEQALEDPQGE